MSIAPRPVARAVLVAGAITLLVTVVRLVGELQGWDARWFGTAPGSPGAIVGIVWLVPVFGFWFGRRLVHAGRAPTSWKRAMLLPLLGFVLLMGGVSWLASTLQGEELMNAFRTWVTFGAPALALLALVAWPSGFLAVLGYAVLARVPVVVVQYLAVHNGWDTHYAKVGPELPAMAPAERAFGLMMAQLTFWVPFTILLGTFAAAVGAWTVRGKRQ